MENKKQKIAKQKIAKCERVKIENGNQIEKRKWKKDRNPIGKSLKKIK